MNIKNWRRLRIFLIMLSAVYLFFGLGAIVLNLLISNPIDYFSGPMRVSMSLGFGLAALWVHSKKEVVKREKEL